MTAKIPPSAATPSPMYAQVMLDIGRKVVRSGPVRNVLIAALVLIFGASCGAADRGYKAAKVAIIDCGKLNLAPAAALVARWAAEDALAGKVQWDKHETDATGFGLGAATCAYAELLKAWRAKPTVQALALTAQPADDGSAGLARLAKGAQVKLADGTVL